MDPANRRLRRSSIRRLRPLDAFIVAAVCALALGLAMPWLGARWPDGPGSTSGLFGEQTGQEEVLDALLDVAWDKALEHVVLQLDREPSALDAPWPDPTVPWGHVPDFTLFDDGVVVYLSAAGASAPIPYSVQLEPEAAQALVDEFVAMGWERLLTLESETTAPVGVDDLGFGFMTFDNLRLRRDGTLTERRVFMASEFTELPGISHEMIMFLYNWSSGLAEPLVVERAALYRTSVGHEGHFVNNTAIEDAAGAGFHYDCSPEYPGLDLSSGHWVEVDPLDWPGSLDVPERFPAFMHVDAMAPLRDLLPVADDTRLDLTATNTSSYWAWTFRLPEGRGTTSEARIIAVPWIYGDRYPNVERDVAAVEDARTAASAAQQAEH